MKILGSVVWVKRVTVKHDPNNTWQMVFLGDFYRVIDMDDLLYSKPLWVGLVLGNTGDRRRRKEV